MNMLLLPDKESIEQFKEFKLEGLCKITKCHAL